MAAPLPPSSKSPEPILSSFSITTDHINNGVHGILSAESSSQFPSPSVENTSPCSGSLEETPVKVANKQKKKTKKRAQNPKENAVAQPSSSSSSSPPQRVTRVASTRRNPRVVFRAARRNSIADVVAFRLGMSMAAFVSQILERKDTPDKSMSADHLALICASAVRESLANDFGDTFDCFVKNFEKSFSSTLRTLKLIKESSVNIRNDHRNHINVEMSPPDVPHNVRGGDSASSLSIEGCSTKELFRTIEYQLNIGNNHENHINAKISPPDVPHDVEDCVHQRGSTSSLGMKGCSTEEHFRTTVTEYQLNNSAAMKHNGVTEPDNLELVLHGQRDQLSYVSSRPYGSMTNQPMLCNIDKSVMEQTRSNDLKTLELSLSMRKLKLKETQLALNFDSNNLERTKLAMGVSKASFEDKKFKTQVEDVRHAELLRTCIDCLVAGLLIMVGSLLYATYIYSYQKITEATASCKPSEKDSRSWWIPNPMASINSGMHILSCQFQAVSRMMFGILMIICTAYLVFQRSGSSPQTMPVTFLVILLAFACGFAGKVCVDSLGGSGYHWILFWETICLVHFFCNVWTSTLFFLLYGPVNVSQGVKDKTRLPYWVRRVMFYATLLLFLPLLCGLIPFAGLKEWKDHFLLRITDYLWATED
ncbi:protein CPR-5 [Humulus lupulus]|uniref:protein CPR-5 n=1 Tax=Humulus lupulus TaxID=3486 RepID=UPI002B40B92A|nr:protein CPR-5 [Humulus lupulus]